MTTTTNAQFVAALQAMTITGVSRHYDEPPASVDISNGYAAFPLMPSGNKGEYVTSCIDSAKQRAMQYIVVIEATGQDTQASKYGKLAAAMDNLETALDALEVSNGGTLADWVEYETATTGDFLIGDSAYWVVVATVTIRNAG